MLELFLFYARKFVFTETSMVVVIDIIYLYNGFIF